MLFDMLTGILIFLMTLLGSIGAIFLKLASRCGLLALIKNKFLYLGGLFYFLSAILNIYLLKIMEYSIVLPIASLTYVWTLLLASKFLNEKITYNKIAGIVFISLGIIFMFII